MTLQIQRCVKTKHSQCLLFLSSSYAFVSKYTVPSIFKRGNGKSSIYRWFSHPDPSKTRIFQQFHCCRLHFNIFQHISCDWWFGTFLVFPYIGNIYIYIIIPTDFHIFRGIGQSPTSHVHPTDLVSRTTSWCSARGRSACVYSHLRATASSTSTRNTTAAPAVATWTSSTPCLGARTERPSLSQLV